jgi:hypothetical protein
VVTQRTTREASDFERWQPEQTHPGRSVGHEAEADQASGCGGATRPEPLFARAVVDVAGRIISKVGAREGTLQEDLGCRRAPVATTAGDPMTFAQKDPQIDLTGSR